MFMSQKEIKRSLVNFYLIKGPFARIVTGCQRRKENINIHMKLAKMKF